MINRKNVLSMCLYFLLLTSYFSLISCGYRLSGSEMLPFESITIKPVINRTYEPRLEERIHTALSTEFIRQGIEVKAAGGEAELEATVRTFLLGAIGAINETVQEQELIMNVDIKVTSGGEVIEYKSMRSPIKITFQSTGSVSGSVVEKEKAVDKASSEIAKEVVSRIIMTYAK